MLMQVSVAIGRRENEWLSEMACFCFQMGFSYASESWVERHVARIPEWARNNSGNPRQRWRQSAGRGRSTRRRDNLVETSTSSSRGQRREDREERRPRRDEPISKEGPARLERSKGGGVKSEKITVFSGREMSDRKRSREDDWTLVQRRGMKNSSEKRMRTEAWKISPIRWEEVKVTHTRQSQSSSAAKRVDSSKVWSALRSSVKQGSSVKGGKVMRPRSPSTSSCGSSATGSRATVRQKFRACPIPWCGGNYANRKGHIYGYHYPTALLMQDQREGNEVTELRVNAIRYLAGVLVGLNK